MQEIVKAYQGGLKLSGTSAYRDISVAQSRGQTLGKESPAVQKAISILNESSEIGNRIPKNVPFSKWNRAGLPVQREAKQVAQGASYVPQIVNGEMPIPTANEWPAL